MILALSICYVFFSLLFHPLTPIHSFLIDIFRHFKIIFHNYHRINIGFEEYLHCTLTHGEFSLDGELHLFIHKIKIREAYGFGPWNVKLSKLDNFIWNSFWKKKQSSRSKKITTLYVAQRLGKKKKSYLETIYFPLTVKDIEKCEKWTISM